MPTPFTVDTIWQKLGKLIFVADKKRDYQRHTNNPINFIYNYSFSLDPENVKPSGACNYSRIDNSHFIMKIFTGHFIDGICVQELILTSGL